MQTNATGCLAVKLLVKGCSECDQIGELREKHLRARKRDHIWGSLSISLFPLLETRFWAGGNWACTAILWYHLNILKCWSYCHCYSTHLLSGNSEKETCIVEMGYNLSIILFLLALKQTWPNPTYRASPLQNWPTITQLSAASCGQGAVSSQGSSGLWAVKQHWEGSNSNAAFLLEPKPHLWAKKKKKTTNL